MENKYPTMNLVMGDTAEFGRIWPIRCEVVDNYFYENKHGDSTIGSRFVPEARVKSIIENDIVVWPDDFVDYDKMDFSFKKNLPFRPEILFEDIRLYKDVYSKEMPDKAHFRIVIKNYKDYKAIREQRCL